MPINIIQTFSKGFKRENKLWYKRQARTDVNQPLSDLNDYDFEFVEEQKVFDDKMGFLMDDDHHLEEVPSVSGKRLTMN